MSMVALAPCAPFNVTGELMKQSAVLARDLKVRLHTHLCETKDEEVLTIFNLRKSSKVLCSKNNNILFILKEKTNEFN